MTIQRGEVIFLGVSMMYGPMVNVTGQYDLSSRPSIKLINALLTTLLPPGVG